MAPCHRYRAQRKRHGQAAGEDTTLNLDGSISDPRLSRNVLPVHTGNFVNGDKRAASVRASVPIHCVMKLVIGV